MSLVATDVALRHRLGRPPLSALDSVAQFENDLMLGRTMAGFGAARRVGGWQRKLKPQNLTQARRRATEGKREARAVAKMHGVSNALALGHYEIGL
jgi:DNA invertase Pin-like site-specific DNA recombinase